MGKLVENGLVKMEWNKSEWLQTVGTKKKPGTFIMAARTYNDKTVFFTTNTVFMFISNYAADGEDLWSAEDLIDYIKSNGVPDGFPNNLDECVPVIETIDDECDMKLLARYGIAEFKADIEARLKDLAPLGYEYDMEI